MVDEKNVESDEEGVEQEEAADEGQETEKSTKGRRGTKRPGNPKNATELFSTYVPYQASRAAAKLRQNLVGTIGVDVTGIRKSFFLDWTEGELKSSEVDQIDNADCRIKLSESDLLEVAKGKLNPQVAMLSHKIHVGGNLSLAIYFFNLFAARVRN